MTDRLRGVRCLATASVLLVAPALAGAQESRSSQLATELVKMLDAMKLDSIAAKAEGDRYVGALYFPGSQLLVVQARYSVPERMDAQLAGKNYRDVYIDLNSASIKDSKTLVSDLGANGLQARRRDDQPYDTVDVGGRSYAFDGDWDKAKISEQEYTKAFEASDAEYTRMLEVLVAHLKKTS
ncbi:MAG: hypothetical protein HYX77_06200 [Acidobacteria bacterium]|nr:hypothetical protein [Acidobacteriota bacterium]